VSWPLVELGRLVEKVNSWNPLKSDSMAEFNYIDLSSVDKDQKAINLDAVSRIIPSEAPSRARQLVQQNDVLVATVRPNLNGVALVSIDLDGATASTGYCVLRTKRDELDSSYLYYWVQTKSFVADMMSKATGANYPAISDKIIKQSKIPLPPLEEQIRIAAILDKADAIRRKRKQAINLADDFLRSVFLDMFGDPVTNPKGWDKISMSDFGTFKNGLNFGRGESGNSLYCLGIGDFKSLDRIEDVTALSKVELNKLPTEDYFLKNDDLVFVRSNGNKALVGRCITMHPGEEKVTFSGFCIRYRIENSKLDANFLNLCLRIPSMKNEMLQGGQGANIQNINQKLLASLSIPLPPIEHQKRFSDLVSTFRLLLTKKQNSLKGGSELFNSLSQKAFSGKL
jgi:type I restriction enzyme S subunit